MTNLNTMGHSVFVKDILIITMSPWIIYDFDRSHVLIVSEKNIEHPDFQTFGASVNKINMCVFNKRETISDIPLKELKDIQNDLKMKNLILL